MPSISSSNKVSTQRIALIATIAQVCKSKGMTTEPVNIRRLANSLPQPLKQISISQLDDDEIQDVTEWYDQQRKPLADILSDLRLAEDNKDNAKARGAVFTPYWLAERPPKKGGKDKN